MKVKLIEKRSADEEFTDEQLSEYLTINLSPIVPLFNVFTLFSSAGTIKHVSPTCWIPHLIFFPQPSTLISSRWLELLLQVTLPIAAASNCAGT